MMIEDVKRLLEEQKTVWEAYKAELTRLEAAGKRTQQEWSEKAQALSDRLDQIDAALKRPSGEETKPVDPAAERDTKYATAFRRYCQKADPSAELELKALSSDADATGGYLLPRVVSDTMIRRLIQISPIRQFAGVVRISAGDTYEEPKEGGTNFAAVWTSERGARPETTAATLKMERTPVHELYANPYVTQKMLDDAEFGLETWLAERLADAFALAEGQAFISGSGVGQPEGILTYGGTDLVVVHSGNANALTADGLIELYYSLPQFYARNGVWLMNRRTLAAVRRMKDANGQYLWSPGFSATVSATEPDTILGRPWVEAPDMPDVAPNATPIVFGDVSRAYRIVDRTDTRVLRDPYSAKPYITFYTTRRVGGQLVLAEAIVKQKVAA